MTLEEILQEERKIWGEGRTPLYDQVSILGTVFGDICRWEMDSRGKPLQWLREHQGELQKEMGNLITTTVRFIDDKCFDVNKCIELALKSQREYRAKNE